MELVKNQKKMDTGELTKKLVPIVRGSSLKVGDKKIMKLLKENGKNLSNFEHFANFKKMYFTGLFLYLFIVGTLLLFFEQVKEYSIYSIIISQIILFIILVIGTSLYKKMNEIEERIHLVLLNITTQMEAE